MKDDDSGVVVRGTAYVRRFAITMGIVIAIATTVAYGAIMLMQRKTLIDDVETTARAYTDLVVRTREWNAMHGAVWVTRTWQATENPYLRRLGVEPNTSTVSGTQLTLRNPSAMTSELSELVARRGGVTFELVSLEPVNPDHSADTFEKASLEGFASNPEPVSRIDRASDGRRLRLVTPLFADESCLNCHSNGYRVGDVRGALTVSVPMTATDSTIRVWTITIAALWVVTILGLGFALDVLVFRLTNRIDESEAELVTMATVDHLTQVKTRRTAFQHLASELDRAQRTGESAGLLVMDIDKFKDVNDRFGHQAGDHVLAAFAACVKAGVRTYDTVGRIGGEEFMVVCPATSESDLITLAERIRSNAAHCSPEEDPGPITVSIGATMIEAGDTVDTAFARADRALYLAKDLGRDRVVASWTRRRDDETNPAPA